MNGNNFGNTHLYCHCICWFASFYT